MKFINERQMCVVCYCMLVVIQCALCVENKHLAYARNSLLMNSGINSNFKHFKSKQNNKPLFTSWVKYIRYDQDTSNIPKEFFINTEYVQQFKGKPHLNMNEYAKDENGYDVLVNIPSQFDFYFMLFDNNYIISKSRHSGHRDTFDTLNIADIEMCPEEMIALNIRNKYGVQDFGNYQEGNCVKVITITQQTWIICTNTLSQKEKLYNELVRAKINFQKKHNINIPSLTYYHSNTNKNSKEVVNGYWVTLQNWSQCSLKCGGGISTLHRKCIPPKNGGKPCEGEPILTKPCNTDPCPDNNDDMNNNNNNNNSQLTPLIQSTPMNNQPYRYIKCVIKESDMLFTNNSTSLSYEDQSNQKQIPVRLVMNDQTISIFNNQNNNKRILTFNLESTSFKRSVNYHLQHTPSKSNCFILKSSTQIAEMCPLIKTQCKEQLGDWEKEFNLFKNWCHPDKLTSRFNIEGELNKKIIETKKAILSQREAFLRKAQLTEDESTTQYKLDKALQKLFNSIRKQAMISEMRKREELEKEQNEEAELEKEIKAQKAKAECIMNTIHEKEMEDKYMHQQKEEKERLNRMEEIVNNTLRMQQQEIENTMKEMRNKNKIKVDGLRQKYQLEKMKINEVMHNAYKHGNIKNCENGLGNEIERNAYCKANFPENIEQYELCHGSLREFCELCCDTEFGVFYLNERAACKNKICVNLNSLSNKPLRYNNTNV